MKLGLISDTHGQVPSAVYEALSGVDHVLHAGDVGSMDVITELEAIAPVSAVLGNTDYGINLPLSRVEVFAGYKCLIHHIVDLPAPSALLHDLITTEKPKVIVFGHTHIPYAKQLGGVWFLNPGSACSPRGGSVASVAIAEIENGQLCVEHRALT